LMTKKPTTTQITVAQMRVTSALLRIMAMVQPFPPPAGPL
jgi:hypothetical protein